MTGTGRAAWPDSPAPAGGVSLAEQRLVVRRTDWRFLLPSPPGACFEHLVLLGGPHALPAHVLRLGIARAVSTALPESGSADAVVRLFDAGVGVHAAASCLKPGGVLYYEIDRARDDSRRTTPARLRRALRAAGLSTAGVYWVRNNFADHRAYIPAEIPAAAEWYFSNVHASGSRRERVVTSCYRLAGALGAPVLARVMRCFAVTAVVGDAARSPASILSIPGLPGELRKPGLRPVVIAPRIRRVVFLPFGPRGRAPMAVLKISRFATRNGRTENEQRALAGVRRHLDRRLRASVPEPLGVFDWGELAVGVESCVHGRMLGRPRRAWPLWAADAQLADLRSVTEWLGEFHRQTRVRHRQWDRTAASEIERALLEYERAFGVTAGEAELFARARDAAWSLLGVTVPTVWCHGDLAPGNAYRVPDGIAVIDWEHGREGLPLLDLLFFVEEWLYNAPGFPSLASRIERFGRLFASTDADEPYSREVHAAIASYMARLELDPRFCPVLHVLLRVDRAVAWLYRADDPDLDEIARQMLPRYVGYVRALAAGAERLFGARTGDGAGVVP